MQHALPSLPARGALPLLLALAPLAGARQEPPGVAERRVLAMGTLLSLEVEHTSRAAALAASERAVEAVERVEARLSTWRPDSELARLNRAPVGEPFPLSPALARELAACEALWTATDGAFDPGLGALLEAWGTRTGGGPAPDAERVEALLGRGLGELHLADGAARRGHPACVLEAGAFGKGSGLDAALAALAGAGARAAVLDFGGQVAMLPSDAPRRFAIAHPRQRARAVVELAMGAGSFATSGTSERGAHLLDPRTGRPAADFGSATAWSSSALRADALSTALYVMGPDAALAWARTHDDVELLVLDDSDGTLRARATAGLRGRLHVLAADVQLTFEQERGTHH